MAMAEPEPCGRTEIGEFLPGFPTVNDYTQHLLTAVLQATKASNELPAEGDDFDYYSSFQGFQDVMAIEGRRCLHLMQSLMKHQNVKGNIAQSNQGVDFEEKLDILIDSNDQLLERVGNWLDEASGLKKKENPLIIATATPKQSATASWNKKSPGSQGSSSSSYRLLAARYTQRPQLKFKEKPNNSSQPFVPIIKYKPHALQPLQESLRLPENIGPDDISKADFIYPHPYQYEIDNLKLDQHQLTATEPMNPLPLQETPLSMISTKADLDKLVERLRSEKEIAVDLEHHSYRTYLGITCLLQISTRKQDFLIDVLELRSDLYVLNEIFADPKIVKVFHGADMDIDWLQRDFGLYVVNMFDTGQASRVLNFSRFSLSHLLQQFCDVEANKQYQLADWRIRPLPKELEQYAREDTHYLLYIYDKLKNQLIESGNDQKNLLMSVIQRSNQICAKVYRKPVFQEDDYLDLFRKSKKVFNSQQLQALKSLYAWRDSVARMEDESVSYVLPNHMLLQIAEILPRERQGVFACCNPIPPLVRQYLVDMHSIVMEAKQIPLVKVEEPSKPKLPSSFQHPKYDVNSLLQFPHDLSHQDQRNVSEDSMDIAPDPELIAGQSSLFLDSKHGRELLVVVKDRPILTAFDYSKHIRQQQMTRAQKKAAKIRALFSSPFEMFLLQEDKESSAVKANNNSDKQQERVWLLKGSSVKRKETEAKSDSSETQSEPAAKRPKAELPTDNDHAETPLRFQMPSKKKVKLKLKNKVAENTTETTTKTEVSNDEMEPKKKKKKKKVNDNTKEDETEFVPYDYTQAKKKLPQASSDKPVVYFDPMKELKSRKGKNVSRPNFGEKKGKKSYTFGKREKKEKTHWPKT